jgi:hypothetical protein
MSEMSRGLRVWCSVCVDSRDAVSGSGTGGLVPLAVKRLRTQSIGGGWRGGVLGGGGFLKVKVGFAGGPMGIEGL